MKKETFKIKEVEGKDTKYWVWCEIPLEHILTEEHIGKRVYISGKELKEKFILKKIHHCGEKYWLSEDGYSVIDSYGIIRSFSKPEVRLHPKEYLIKPIKKTKGFKRKITKKEINDNLEFIKKMKKKNKRRNKKL